MTGSLDLGRWAVAACVLVAVAVLVPIGLASVGFGALLAVAGGATPNAATSGGSAGGGPRDQPSPNSGAPPDAVVLTSIWPPIAGRGLISGWSAPGPINQYARANYRSGQSWLTWSNVDCSAAAPDWLLGAYGHQLGSLDDAIALVGPGPGISTRLGLLDARGPALAQALAASGLPRRAGGHHPPRGGRIGR